MEDHTLKLTILHVPPRGTKVLRRRRARSREDRSVATFLDSPRPDD
jgi:hypothetical protein